MLSDADYMARALALAERGRGRTSPNPMVGAVVVSREGIIVGQGYHARAGGPHAEIYALEAAGPRARGATLYCTLEPCCHVGRTGPCVHRITAAGVTRVVAATADPNPLVSGRGFAYLSAHGIDVRVGARADEAARLNRAFFTYIRKRRPHVILKAAISLDGRIAAAPGVRTAITSEAANRHAHALRAEVDAIGVGSATVLIDDPLLTVRSVHRERPLARVIFDRRLRTPPSARVFSSLDRGPVRIVTTVAGIAAAPVRADALRAAGAELVPCDDGSLRGALERLASFEITSLLLEGGAELHAAAWDAGLVDAVHLFVAPRTIGPQGVPWLNGRHVALAALTERTVVPYGPDIVIEGVPYPAYVHRAD
jgi:diaminohydroxyphosphoribosylaminopyrimidine deaminase/5-amino-6-(5-phosphoribosylamino)uracil reductase